MNYRRGQFWQPDVTVACVVVRDGRLLVVEEQVRGRLVLNQPAGHLEPDESLLEAARRETLEETGWHVEPTSFIGAYQWKSPPETAEDDGRHYLRMAFAADPIRHETGRAAGSLASTATKRSRSRFRPPIRERRTGSACPATARSASHARPLRSTP